MGEAVQGGHAGRSWRSGRQSTWGRPACAYTRKRPFHPDDGVEFYQLTIPMQGGQEAGEGGLDGRGGNLLELSRTGKLVRVTGVWGGYQDAGDWDSLGGHLSATYDLLGLYDLNPAAFSRIRLSLPAEEMQQRPARHPQRSDVADAVVAAVAACRRRRARRLRIWLGLPRRRRPVP